MSHGDHNDDVAMDGAGHWQTLTLKFESKWGLTNNSSGKWLTDLKHEMGALCYNCDVSWFHCLLSGLQHWDHIVIDRDSNCIVLDVSVYWGVSIWCATDRELQGAVSTAKMTQIASG